jgi:outer membrane protein OmpA-like peptidoglycan-associated protein
MKLTIIICALLMFGTLALADGTNIQTTIPSTSSEFVLTEDALLCRDHCKGIGLGLNYIYLKNPLVVVNSTTNSQTQVLVNSIQTLDAFLSYRFRENVAVGVAAPLNLSRTADGVSHYTFGDTRAFLKWRFTDTDSPIAVAFMPEVRLPTGSKTYFTSDDSYGYGFRLTAEKDLGYFIAAAHAGFWRMSNSAFADLIMRNRIPLGLGAMIPFSKNDRQWAANIEVNAQPVLAFDNTLDPSQLYGGLRYESKSDFVFTVGASIGKFGGPSGADYAINAGFRLNLMDCPPATPRATPEAAAPAPTPVAAHRAEAPRVHITHKAIEVTEEIKFEEGSDVLTKSGQSLLDEVATVIKANQSSLKKIYVDGHTNRRGGYKYNMDLSNHRAVAVKEYLVSRGVKETLLEPRGFGFTKPKNMPGLTQKQHFTADRRVEFKVER